MLKILNNHFDKIYKKKIKTLKSSKKGSTEVKIYFEEAEKKISIQKNMFCDDVDDLD